MGNINTKEIDSVINLLAPKRYEYFIKKCVGWNKIWGLYDNGWAMVGGDENRMYFPLWPAAEYAQLCANNSWKSYKPKSIDLEELLEKYIPDFEENKIQVAAFMTPKDNAITVSPKEFVAHINFELSKY